MEEHQEIAGASATDVTSNDKLWAALSWLPPTPLWPLMAVLALLLDETKDRPFVRYNAVLSLVTGAALIPISIVTLGCGALLYLVFFYWAYQAFMGQEVKVPFLSDWVKRQGWA
ncbi:MAG: hypothetical protein RBU35_24230 [Anaerolineae bacterium]|jgi:uncharacterized membrane protein|nr:hypothetical protein [Anaerolineae bacterium]